mgnify:CR=1 FL=1
MNARLLEIKKIIKRNGGEKKYLDDAGGFFAISYCDVIKIIKETGEKVVAEINLKNVNTNIVTNLSGNPVTDKKNLIVNFEIRGSLSNFDVLKNPDTRKLGLKFNSLIVKKI